MAGLLWKRRMLVESAEMRRLVQFWILPPAQMKSNMVRRDEDEDLLEDELSLLIHLCHSRKDEERGEKRLHGG